MIVWWALAGAMFASVSSVAALWMRTNVLRQFAWATPDLPWMAPVANVVVFGVVGLVLVGVQRLVPRLRGGSVAPFVLTLLAVLSALLLVPSIWQYASLLLAIGAATQVTRQSRRHPAATRRAVIGVALGGGAISAACAVPALTAGTRDTAEGAPIVPAAQPAAAPNVLILLLDTVRAMSLSLYGYEQPTTPELERLAGSSLVFDRAFATAPWTLPTHCSLFTGRYARELPCRWQSPLDDAPATLAERLQARGYRTGGFVANHYYTTRETGLARGFDTWRDFQRTWKELFCSATLLQASVVRGMIWGSSVRQRLWSLRRFRLAVDPKPEHDRKTAEQVNREFLGWQARDRSRPFFAFLNYFDAHDPFGAPPPFDTLFPPAPYDRHLYEGGIAYIDQQIGALLRELERRGALSNTIVIVTADHGEHLGDQGLGGHGNSLYLPLLHVPLLIHAPGRVPAGVRVAMAVSLRDVAATVLDLVGGSTPLPGRSLRVAWDPEDAAEPSAALAHVERSTRFWGNEPARFDSLEAVLDDRYHYIRTFGGREQLFDYVDDPREEHDLVAAGGADSVRRRMRVLLEGVATPDVTSRIAGGRERR